jgi:tetratricopeptide (TPR) repeat protein
MKPDGRIAMLLLEVFSQQEAGREWLAQDCLRRAAFQFEQAQVWQEAAHCWREAGETNKAAELYLLLDDYEHAAALLVAAGRYTEAQSQYEQWLSALRPDDAVGQVTAHLGIALCLTRLKSPHAARGHYRTARAIIEADNVPRDRLTQGRCWEALGQYGLRAEREDIVQVAYENALASYGRQHHGERLRAAQAYLSAVKENRLLAEDLSGRVAEWLAEQLLAPPRKEDEPGRFAAFVARGRAGNVADVDYLMHRLEQEPDLAVTKLADYALGLVRTPHGEERIKHYLFEGTQKQRNFAALYFKRTGERGSLLAEAYIQGKIDRVQAFAR